MSTSLHINYTSKFVFITVIIIMIKIVCHLSAGKGANICLKLKFYFGIKTSDITLIGIERLKFTDELSKTI